MEACCCLDSPTKTCQGGGALNLYVTKACGARIPAPCARYAGTVKRIQQGQVFPCKWDWLEVVLLLLSLPLACTKPNDDEVYFALFSLSVGAVRVSLRQFAISRCQGPRKPISHETLKRQAPAVWYAWAGKGFGFVSPDAYAWILAAKSASCFLVAWMVGG